MKNEMKNLRYEMISWAIKTELLDLNSFLYLPSFKGVHFDITVLAYLKVKKKIYT